MISDSAATALDLFLELCCVEIERRAAVSELMLPELSKGAKAFRRALAGATPTEAERGSQPVVEQLSDIATSPIIEALRGAAGEFPWVQYPPLGDEGQQVALGRINHVRDFGEVNCGLMLIGARSTFPLHSHPPQELYLPITDGGSWQVGGATDFRAYGPDDLPYNNPHDIHSVRADEQPLLALFVLWP